MEKLPPGELHLAVIIPCYNEESTIATVVKDALAILPAARVYVCDNCCSDRTAEAASAAGATVIKEPRLGKGFAVSTLLRKVDADLYLLIDGDDTYPIDQVKTLLQPALDGQAQMVVGTRLAANGHNSFRPFHRNGNRLIAWSVNIIFNSSLTDVMSGIRVFTRHFAKSVPLISRGFEIETLMSIQALYYQFPILEVPIAVRERPFGSLSKLSTVRDGARIILAVINAFKAYRPLLFFSGLALLSATLGAVLCLGQSTPFEAGFSRNMLGIMFFICSIAFAACGLILDTVNHRLRELGQLLLMRTD